MTARHGCVRSTDLLDTFLRAFAAAMFVIAVVALALSTI